VPGAQFFSSAYENWREDKAANSSVAVNACTQQLVGLLPTGSAAKALPGTATAHALRLHMHRWRVPLCAHQPWVGNQHAAANHGTELGSMRLAFSCD
jgi:hypothetical protein